MYHISAILYFIIHCSAVRLEQKAAMDSLVKNVLHIKYPNALGVGHNRFAG